MFFVVMNILGSYFNELLPTTCTPTLSTETKCVTWYTCLTKLLSSHTNPYTMHSSSCTTFIFAITIHLPLANVPKAKFNQHNNIE